MLKRLRFLGIFVLLSCLLPACAVVADETRPEDISIDCEARIEGFSENPVRILLKRAGKLTVVIRDGMDNVLRTLCRDTEADAGETALSWDGLGENEEIPDIGSYVIRAELKTETGTVMAEKNISLTRVRNAVLFAFPSAKAFWPGDEDWFLEIKLARAGVLKVDFSRAEEPEKTAFTRKWEVTGSRVRQYGWKALTGGREFEPGDWILRFCTDEVSEIRRVVRVTLLPEMVPETPVGITGAIIPEEDATAEEIWSLMTAPAVVVDSRPTTTQKIFADREKRAGSLGTVHGQSQCLQVLETDEEWTKVAAWNHETADYVEGWIPTKKLKTVYPNTEYGLLLDKKAQTLTLWKDGEPFTTLKVSTGMISKGKLFNETPAGSYLTDEHMLNFSMNGCKYDYVIRYDGGNLLHQLPYQRKKNGKDYAAGETLIGTKASHGCIRIQHELTEEGVNAYWLWTHIPYRTRLIILDDKRERWTARLHLENKETPDEWLQDVPDAPAMAEGETEIRLTWTGNVLPGTWEKQVKHSESISSQQTKMGSQWFLSGLKDVLERDDLTIVPLENVLKDDGTGANQLVRNRVRGNALLAGVLKSGQVDLTLLTGTHLQDYGATGLESTEQALNVQRMPFFRDVYAVEIKGKRIGFCACSQQEFAEDRHLPARRIAELKEQGADWIICCCYWCEDGDGYHINAQQALARVCAEADADLVLGCGPACLQGIALIDDTPVIWSLGNLLDGRNLAYQTSYGALASIGLRYGTDGQKAGISLQLIPLTLNADGSLHKPAVVREPTEKERILQLVQKDSGIRLKDSMWFPSGQGL